MKHSLEWRSDGVTLALVAIVDEVEEVVVDCAAGPLRLFQTFLYDIGATSHARKELTNHYFRRIALGMEGALKVRLQGCLVCWQPDQTES